MQFVLIVLTGLIVYYVVVIMKDLSKGNPSSKKSTETFVDVRPDENEATQKFEDVFEEEKKKRQLRKETSNIEKSKVEELLQKKESTDKTENPTTPTNKTIQAEIETLYEEIEEDNISDDEIAEFHNQINSIEQEESDLLIDEKKSSPVLPKIKDEADETLSQFGIELVDIDDIDMEELNKGNSENIGELYKSQSYVVNSVNLLTALKNKYAA